MKKIYSFCFVSCMVVSLSAQTYLSEDFSAGMMPPAGWSFDYLPELWTVAGTHMAGGFAPEGVFTPFGGPLSSRLISPAVNLTGVTTVTLMFNHNYAWFFNPAPTLSVMTRSGGFSGTWHRLYPNPFSEATHIGFRLDKTSMVGVKLYDLPGKLMYELKPCFYQPGENNLRIGCDHPGSGLYILEMNIDGKMFTQKVSVVK